MGRGERSRGFKLHSHAERTYSHPCTHSQTHPDRHERAHADMHVHTCRHTHVGRSFLARMRRTLRQVRQKWVKGGARTAQYTSSWTPHCVGTSMATCWPAVPGPPVPSQRLIRESSENHSACKSSACVCEMQEMQNKFPSEVSVGVVDGSEC